MKRYIDNVMFVVADSACAVFQGGSVAMSQSAETGSSTAMMDVDSMTSQVCVYYSLLLASILARYISLLLASIPPLTPITCIQV